METPLILMAKLSGGWDRVTFVPPTLVVTAACGVSTTEKVVSTPAAFICAFI